MAYDPSRHHRRSIRLKGYDYSQAGAYYLTVCLQSRELLFGEMVQEEMHPNDAGLLIEKWWQELTHKYPTLDLDEYIVMPNHFHGILAITEDSQQEYCLRDAQEGRPILRCRPSLDAGPDPPGRPHRAAPRDSEIPPVPPVGAALRGRPEHVEGAGSPGRPHRDAPTEGEPIAPAKRRPTVGDIMDWFKTMTTNEYIRGVKQLGWPRFPGKLWQRDYYEHIIRDEYDLDRIREYITMNPPQWAWDRQNPDAQPCRPPDVPWLV